MRSPICSCIGKTRVVPSDSGGGMPGSGLDGLRDALGLLARLVRTELSHADSLAKSESRAGSASVLAYMLSHGLHAVHAKRKPHVAHGLVR